MSVRVGAKAEVTGLDSAEHGQSAYINPLLGGSLLGGSMSNELGASSLKAETISPAFK